MSAPSKGRRILVTGASGFVGRYLVAHLQAQQYDVATWGTEIDVRHDAMVAAAIRNAQPDAVIHLAAIAAPIAARANPREAWDVNVIGTFNVAQAVLHHAPRATLVFVGSSESYGLSFNVGDRPITEDTAFAPAGAYGATKAAADLMLGQMAREGLRVVRLRPFNHTGPGQHATYVVSDFARQIATIEAGGGNGVLHVGNLDAQRDFLDVRDVVKTYAMSCTAEIPPGTAINISTGHPVAIRAILDQLVTLSTANIRVEVDAARLRPSEVAIASGDPSRAAALLGWQPEIPFAQTLTDVLNYWRSALAASHDR